MRGVATDIGTIHFVGIGGIGMSGIAEVMANLGYTVQGSDIAEGYVVEGLRARGIRVFIGHAAANLGDAAVVVTSTAVKRENPEVVAALEARIPVVRRAEMLAELMRLKSTVAVAGTHGKTTTTSMIAALLDAGGVDPTVINGGIINSSGSNARLGASDWMVVEADESDGSFLRLDGTIAVVTNIDPEHLDHYGSFDRVKACFVEFIENVPFYGAAVLCIDHPEVQAIIPKVRDRRVVTYGFSAQADVRGEHVTPIPGGNRFAAALRQRDGSFRRIEDIELPMPGRHNVQNALAAVAVAVEMGVDDAIIRTGFAKFAGVKRRFTKVGEVAFAGDDPATIILLCKTNGHVSGALFVLALVKGQPVSATGQGFAERRDKTLGTADKLVGLVPADTDLALVDRVAVPWGNSHKLAVFYDKVDTTPVATVGTGAWYISEIHVLTSND